MADPPGKKGGAASVPEPYWTGLLKCKTEREKAKRHWRRITEEMCDRETLSPSNAHSVQRLILAYIVYDRCSAEVAKTGLVDEPTGDNPRAIARLSIHFKVMSEAEKTAERLEAQLCLSPQRRGKDGKVVKRRERSAGADAYRGPRG